MIAVVPQQRAFVVWWHELDKWMVPAATVMARRLPKGWTIVRLADLVRQVTDRIEANPQQQYKMAGVKWYGEGVFHRETVRGNEMSAKYVTPLKAGALIYNRLFAWKASFAVVPDELADCNVSSEFPQFIVDETKLLPAYLHLFCISSATVRAVLAASTGSSAVSRNRFREELFLDFEIPLPPLEVQRAIVTKWETTRAEISDTRRRIVEMEEQIEADFLAELGLSKPKRTALSKAFTVWWKDFDRWSVSFNQLSQTSIDLKSGRYPVASLGRCISRIQYGTSEKANVQGKGVAVLRINNIKAGSIDLTDVKHVTLTEKAKASLLLSDGDLLIIRTSGSRDLVGTCAVFHHEDQCVFASYLIRLRLDPMIAHSDFVAFFINSSLGRQQVDALSRQIMQNNINSEEIRSILIPLPPLDVQRKMVDKIESKRKKSAISKTETVQKSTQAKADIDAMILGEERTSL